MCGHLEAGCANFVFDPSSGVCVLLPLTPISELDKDDNDGVISGTASVGIVAVGAAAFNVDSCSFIPDSGYSSGSMGIAPRLPGGEMQTREECCQVCGVTKGCARFTFSPGTKTCLMYVAYAEMVMVSDLTSGSIPSKLSGVELSTLQHGVVAADVQPAAAAALALLPQPPSLPVFAKLQSQPPPPPPDINSHGDSSALQDIIGDLSVVVFTAILVGFFLCVYCCFAPQILSTLHHATNGKMGKVHVRSHRYVHHKLAADEDQFVRMRSRKSTAIVPVDEPPKRKKKGGKKNGQRQAANCGDDGRRDERVIDLGGLRTVRLVVQTTAITQSKDVQVGLCQNLEALRSLFYDEFTSVLKDVRPANAQVFCLAPAPPPKMAVLPPSEHQQEEPMAWLLVTDQSDFMRVMECPAFRLQDERCDEALTAQYVVAFAQSHDLQAQMVLTITGKKKKKSKSVVNCAPPPLVDCAPPREVARSVVHCAPPPSEMAPPVEDRRGRSRDRRAARVSASAPPPSCVGVSCSATDADNGAESGSDDSATSSRQSLLRGTGTTCAPCIPAPDLARLAACHAAEAAEAAALTGQAFALTSSSLQHMDMNCQLPGCNSIPPRASSVAGSAWYDEDPDGTGVSRSARSERVRPAVAESVIDMDME